MKTLVTFLIVSFLFIAMKNDDIKINHGLKEITADSILQKMSFKLSSLKNIRYDLKRELNYSSENYHNEMNWTIYFDFQSTDTIIGFKYQIEDETLKKVFIFNGTEEFELNKKAKTIKIDNQPNQKLLSNNSAFYNSIITLKNVLPIIIADKTIIKIPGDTIINNISYNIITLYLNKRRIQFLGKDFEAMTTKSNLIYKIIIDKKDDLPFEVLQVNDIDSDFIKTSFTNINTTNPLPSESSWFYSTYTDEYKQAIPKELPKLVSVGSSAPEWILPRYNKEENIALSDFKGKVVLLDFWIKNCGHCIESIPDLNALQEKFKNNNFEILGINSYDSKEDIGWFCNKHKPNYKILMQGKAIAEKYGVSGFPMVFLIDKKGNIVFSGGIEKSEMERLIEKIL